MYDLPTRNLTKPLLKKLGWMPLNRDSPIQEIRNGFQIPQRYCTTIDGRNV